MTTAWLASAALATAVTMYPQQPQVTAEFCNYFITLGQSAQNGFRDLRGANAHGDDEFVYSKLTLPKATECVIDRKGLLFCTWEDRKPWEIKGEFDQLANAIRACFPSAKTQSYGGPELALEGLDVFVAAGERGGPTTISVKWEKTEIILYVEKTRPRK